MATLAIEINDAGLRARDESGVVADSPGHALVDGDVTVGAAARSQARLHPGRSFDDFWGDLSLEALPPSARGAATCADLAYHHLNEVWSGMKAKPDRVILVVPGSYSREQLSLLLGIARECGLPVGGLVDQAVVAAENPAPGRQLFHLELLRRRAVLTELVQGGRLRRERVSTIDDAGQADFYDAWANAVGDTFVRNTRFDPMHSAQSEQIVYDELPGWVAAVSQAGRAELTLSLEDRDHSVVMSAQTLAEAAKPLYRRFTRHIAAGSRPGEPLTLLLSDRLHGFPGLRETLADSLPDCELVELGAGQAGIGALRRQDEIVSGGESVAFVTSVAWRRDAVSLPLPGEARPGDRQRPTHVLYRGRGWPIGADALHLGSQPAESQPSIVLTGDLAGVSRDHCRISRRDDAVFVDDNSEHGTFLNDRRVDGAAEVHYGDVLRLGGADQLVQLIRIPENDGA